MDGRDLGLGQGGAPVPIASDPHGTGNGIRRADAGAPPQGAWARSGGRCAGGRLRLAAATAGGGAGPSPDELPEGWGQERRLWWLLWSACPGLGWVSLRAIEAHFGGLAQAWLAPLDRFPRLEGRTSDWRQRLARFREQWGERPLERWSAQVKAGRGVLLPGDPASPDALRQLARPPLGLYWRGRGSLWPLLARRKAVAVVGTRRPSRAGLAMAEALGRALAQAGWPVVSGLADGIDAASHRGCLQAGGRPVAVLGTPLERVYPSHHRALQEQVAREGLLISEQPPGASVCAGHFAARNRLQVALASAVVLVECPDRSGALHSAQLAWEQQLPLWVVPGDAGRLSARGSNRWLGRGATLLLEPGDLIRQLEMGPLGSRPAPVRGATGGRAAQPPDPELLQALGGGASLEQLCLALEQPASALAPRLLALELAGAVRSEPGLNWRPCSPD
jgi:DNA processing protein